MHWTFSIIILPSALRIYTDDDLSGLLGACTSK